MLSSAPPALWGPWKVKTRCYLGLVLTGDLALVGHSLAEELLSQAGLSLKERLQDCGLLVFDRSRQKVFVGGSGCGCSAVVFCGHIMELFRLAKLKRVLLVGTGALLSPTTFQQGESIPCVAHAVAFELCDDRMVEMGGVQRHFRSD
ncbi:MAG: Stage V sporulation protein AD [Firmicutes bacterium]|nr:Stage V sporulation protein AD [candidate division NPL-UPA2 bacterium]